MAIRLRVVLPCQRVALSMDIVPSCRFLGFSCSPSEVQHGYFTCNFHRVPVFLEFTVVALRTWERVSGVGPAGAFPRSSRPRRSSRRRRLRWRVVGSDMDDIVAKLEKLKSLLDANAISQEEFDRKKAKLLHS